MNQNRTATDILLNDYADSHSLEVAELINTISDEQALDYLHSIPPGMAARIFSLMNPEFAVALISNMDETLFTTLFTHMDAGTAARLLSRFEPEHISVRLNTLPDSQRSELQELMHYPPETAGYLMDPHVNTFYPDQLVAEALNRIRKTRDKRITSIYLIDTAGMHIGTIGLQDLATAPLKERLGALSQGKPVSVLAMAPKEDILEVIDQYRLSSLPVIDAQGKLLGVIRYDTLVSTAKSEASEDLQTIFGAGKEEKSTSKVLYAVSKRLPWLEINLATAFLAAAVVGLFEETIARITVLAVFLPVVAGQSGNTGSQSLAVTMRGLVLREFRPRQWFRIAKKETAVGFINGCAVALTTSVIVYFWESSALLAFVIGTAMIVSMVIAGLSGAVIPILLKQMGQDPAQSSSIILTTVTDITGFFSFLGLATFMIKTFNLT